jgi:hypothetical protein
MQQLLHLLVVDRDRRTVLAAWHDARWLLPLISCPETVRSGPRVLRWAAERDLRGSVAGQWLGRVTPDGAAIDWLLVVDVRATSPNAPPGLCWASRDALASSPSLLEYQQWAIRRATKVDGSLAVAGPFGSLTWPEDVTAWACDAAGVACVESVIPHRTSPHHVVLALSTLRGYFYFKGLGSECASEPSTTATLSSLAPDRFARTRALESRSNLSTWWLTEACPGQALARRPSADGAARVAAACADVQRRVLTSGAIGIPCIDLSSAEAWAMEVFEDSDVGADSGPCRAATARAFRTASRNDVARSWIPLDLDPENVILDEDGGVRFIDLDDSFVGPAPLALATFARRVARLQVASQIDVGPADELYLAYAEAWPMGVLMGCERIDFEIVSTVLEAHLGWSRVMKCAARGEVAGALDSIRARLARRLVRDLVAFLGRRRVT